jgi:hypothetical protein
VKLSYLAKTPTHLGWQIFAQREPNGVSALIFAATRQEAVTEAVRWIGRGDSLKTLDMALDGLSEALERLNG